MAIRRMLTGTFITIWCFCAVFFAVAAPAAAVPLTAAERRADAGFVFALAAELYPFLHVKERLVGRAWDDWEDDFYRWAAAAEDPRAFYQALNRMAAQLHNDHAHIVDPAIIVENFLHFSEHRFFGSQFDQQVLEANRIWAAETAAVEAVDEGAVAAFWARYIGGRYAVVQVQAKYEDVLPIGAEIAAVNGQPVHEYVQTSPALSRLQWDPVDGRLYRTYLPLPRAELLQLTIWSDETEQEVQITPFFVPTQSPETETERENVRIRVLDADRAIYAQIASFSYEHYLQDGPLLRKFWEQAQDYPYIIIDIRGNGGGTTAYWRNLLVGPSIAQPYFLTHYVSVRQHPIAQRYLRFALGLGADFLAVGRRYDPRWGQNAPELLTEAFSEQRLFPNIALPRSGGGDYGQIILLVDDLVYSAAENLAVFAKETGWALVAGTQTGGDGIGLDPGYFVLPHSRLVLRMPLVLGIDSRGRINEQSPTQPDLFLQYAPEDFSVSSGENGLPRDNMIQTLLQIIQTESLPEPGADREHPVRWVASLAEHYLAFAAYGLPRILPHGAALSGEGPWAVRDIVVAGTEKTDARGLQALAERSLQGSVTVAAAAELERRLQALGAWQHVSVALRGAAADSADVVIQVLEGNPLLQWPPRDTAAIMTDLAQQRLSLSYANLGGYMINVGGQLGFGAAAEREMHLEFPWWPAAGRLAVGQQQLQTSVYSGQQRYLRVSQKLSFYPRGQLTLGQSMLAYEVEPSASPDGQRTDYLLGLTAEGAYGPAQWPGAGSAVYVHGAAAVYTNPVAGPITFSLQLYGGHTHELGGGLRLELDGRWGWLSPEAPEYLYMVPGPLVFAAAAAAVQDYWRLNIGLAVPLVGPLTVKMQSQWAREDKGTGLLWGVAGALQLDTGLGLNLNLQRGVSLVGPERAWRFGITAAF